jgi:hypothetical protein
MIAFTVATVSYAALTRVTMASIRATSPSMRRVVVFLDDVDDQMPDTECYEVLRIGDLGLDPTSWITKRVIYTPFELSCAMKADVALALLRDADEPVLYVDSDIVLYDDIAPALARSTGFDLTIAPHLVVPTLAGPGHNPDAHYRRYGPVNAGMFMVSRRSIPFLRWWQAQNEFDCLDDPDGHDAFVDQLCLAMAPNYWSVDITRDPTMNIAFWNLVERPLTIDGGRPLVDGRPVTYLHFSGFDPVRPELFSKNADAAQLALADAMPAVGELLEAYVSAALAAGHLDWCTRPYAWAVTADGVPLSSQLRRATRRAIVDRLCAGAENPMPDPFVDGLSALSTWLKTGRGPAAPSAPAGRTAPGRVRLNDLAVAARG